MISESDIKTFTDAIVQYFNPEKIILFGSYAYGTPSDNSDLDLLIVMPFEGKSTRKSLEIWSRIKPAFSCDLIVKRPDEFSKRYKLGDPLIGEAVDKGKVLYERTN